MQPLEIDSAVFCDGAHYTIISRENSSILTCPVASGAGGYTLNRVEVRDIDREAERLTGHAACIAVDVPTWCRIAGDPLDLGISTKQGADFYRDAFGLSSFTEAVVWPSSDRDAAFVMTSAVDSEDGDLAVYKIDAGLIGDGEITADDIERLGGKRELCVYKHGLDGIEAIRAFANRVAVDRFDERFGVNNLYGELPDLAPTLRKVTEGARTAAQKPRNPQAIAAAALSAAEGGAKGAVELVGNKR